MHNFNKAQRLNLLPPYLFSEIDKRKKALIEKGVNIINMGVGDPDLPTPTKVINKLQETAINPENHQYPSYEGMLSFRETIAEYYKKKYNVELDPKKEVLTLIGSKEGIAHISLAYINPGDSALVPDPAYPVYQSGVIFAGGNVHIMPLLWENNFLPDLSNLKSKIQNPKLLFINYPNNPTGAIANKKFFDDVVSFAKEHNIIVCHDGAYLELYYSNEQPPSFMQSEGAKDIGIEFGSLSKPFNMTGWRIGYAVGNAEILSALLDVKKNIDSGVFQAIQYAGISAFKDSYQSIEEQRNVYKRRWNLLKAGLKEIGWNFFEPGGAFYVWVKVPNGYTSERMSIELLENCGIVVTPGNGFGKYGEGYIRLSLTLSEEKIKEAINRIKLVAL